MEGAIFLSLFFHLLLCLQLGTSFLQLTLSLHTLFEHSYLFLLCSGIMKFVLLLRKIITEFSPRGILVWHESISFGVRSRFKSVSAVYHQFDLMTATGPPLFLFLCCLQEVAAPTPAFMSAFQPAGGERGSLLRTLLEVAHMTSIFIPVARAWLHGHTQQTPREARKCLYSWYLFM